ncbi:MAG: hypothetical protein A2289_21155 [Deltaproteobacteria bacterium RIFOXYA12_FULL_58_15]|nr:MAG: hypothetical protein A2289_21155 [Deltaproteobacteria bacterium RIFOXYA12_FULL_58_15]OGR08713.1 MAG: hypothetical protein A2341_00765 [Deltaproteobacteria bacterium RIFOXYB12_FULL_58_9]
MGCDSNAVVGQTTCSGCLIDGICYPPAVTHPVDSCKICNAAHSPESWTNNDGAFCDDGVFCNGRDECSAGACVGGTGSACNDDGMFCNGTESCNESARTCEHTGNPCGAGLWCNESADSCVAICGGCLIQGICVFDGQPHPGNPCLGCDVATSSTSWTVREGSRCSDDGLYCTGIETCAGTACVSSGNPCSDTDVCWEDSGGQCCAEGIFVCNADQDVEEYDSCGHRLGPVIPCGSGGATCDDGHCLCNPVTQAGCAADNKCAIVSLEPLCRPNGDKGFGQACTVDSEGGDDCAAGGYCNSNICAEICHVEPDTCGDSFICLSQPFSYTTTLGLCEPMCDPVLQDCQQTNQACYPQLGTGHSFCAEVPVEAEGLLQGDLCYGDNQGTCYSNGCDEGFAPLLPDDRCAFLCNPIDNWLNHVAGLTGDPAGVTCDTTFGGERPDGPGSDYECRFIQSYYSNSEYFQSSVGMCVSLLDEGSCADFDWPALQADIGNGIAIDEVYCAEHPERCMWSCIARETLNSAF